MTGLMTRFHGWRGRAGGGVDVRRRNERSYGTFVYPPDEEVPCFTACCLAPECPSKKRPSNFRKWSLMVNARERRLPPKLLQADLDAFEALKAIGDYKAVNPTFEIVNVISAKADMDAKQIESSQDRDTAETSRLDKIAKQRAFHDFIIGAKIQIRAQFGDNSNEIQSMGLKKKSEYKSPKKKTP